MKNICFIVRGYPTKDDPFFAFIRPVVTTIADMGYNCTVVCTQSITSAIHNHVKIRPHRWYDVTDKGNKIEIIQPKYLSVSNLTIHGKSLSIILETLAFKHAFKKLKISPDLVYAHFWDIGMTAAQIIDNQHPLVVVTGEETINVIKQVGREKVDELLPKVKGVISVSTKNIQESDSLGLLVKNPKLVVLPNAVDSRKFHQMDQKECRDQLGLPQNDTIAIFVGDYVERKGILRVLEAAKGIPDLKIIAIGKGPQEPSSSQVIFKGCVPHDKLPQYLNASDIFVLPTLAEGCCNAIVEAVACGLPVVSSDMLFNKDILNRTNSILIDPQSIEEIQAALQSLCENEQLRKQLSLGALKKAEELSIEYRVQKIVQFLEEVHADFVHEKRGK